MSLHEDLIGAINREMEELGAATALSPTSVALAVQRRYMQGALEPHLQYASLEYLKQMARQVMAGRYESEGEQNDSHQGDMFSGHLQERYPIQRTKGAEPIYKRREDLSEHELQWNVEQLRKSASARLQHADALAAWAKSRGAWPVAA